MDFSNDQAEYSEIFEHAKFVFTSHVHNLYSIEIIDIECVLGHESCLHFFSQVPF